MAVVDASGAKREVSAELIENLENLYMSYLDSLIGGVTDEMPK